MSALDQLAADAATSVEQLTAKLDQDGPDEVTLATLDGLAGRLDTVRGAAQDATPAAVAESLVAEAACLLLISAHRPGDDRRALAVDRLDRAVAVVAEKWPALRMSVLLRAMALAAPLLRGDTDLASQVEQRLEQWAQLVAAARRRQTELAADAASDLALADHLAARLDRLDEQRRGPVRDRAREHAEAARLAATFAGDRPLSRRARQLAQRLA